MGHHHDHGHGHHHHHTDNTRMLFYSFMIIFTFMIVEAIGGYLTNSLALLSDAGHMLSDAAALGLSLLAFKIGERQATNSKTYGYRRFEIIASFLNGVTLIIIALYIFYEAFNRFLYPPEVSGTMMIIAIIGLIINIIVAYLLMSGASTDNLNIRSALVHVIGDMLGSIGAIIAGVLIILFNWNIADPIASVIVAVLIIFSGSRITRDAIHILMEGKPDNISITEISNSLKDMNGVKDVHHIHVWSITSEFPAMSCHIVVDDTINRDEVLIQATKKLKESFDISHTTIQIEGPDVTHDNNSCQTC